MAGLAEQVLAKARAAGLRIGESMTIVTTFFGAGHLRPAPGTWASAIAIALGIAIDRWLGYPALVVATVLAIVLGLWAWDAHGADIWRDGIFSFCV